MENQGRFCLGPRTLTLLTLTSLYLYTLRTLAFVYLHLTGLSLAWLELVFSTEDRSCWDGTVHQMPRAISLYNETMGGVHLGDQPMQEYHPNLMSVKMWKKVLLSFLMTATDRYLLESVTVLFVLSCGSWQWASMWISFVPAVNSSIMFRANHPAHRLTWLAFTEQLCLGLIGEYRQQRRRAGPP